jgi:uncharacterized protein
MRRLLFTLLLVVVTGTAQAAGLSFPPLTGRVVDQAGILSPGAEQTLSAELEAHERSTSQQVVVATIASLEGSDIAEYGVELGRAWGIGQKDKNTGVILLVAPNERAVRIEVGYGLEGTLTDATSRLIIENAILPQFRAGNMEAGILAGARSILGVLRGDPDATPKPAPIRSRDPGGIPIFTILLILFILTRFRGRRRGLFPVILGGPTVWHGGGRRGGGFGGGSRGGGFSGGGGSFGGGGASGRW